MCGRGGQGVGGVVCSESCLCWVCQQQQAHNSNMRHTNRGTSLHYHSHLFATNQSLMRASSTGGLQDRRTPKTFTLNPQLLLLSPCACCCCRRHPHTPHTGSVHAQPTSPTYLPARIPLHVGVLHYSPTQEPFPLLADPERCGPGLVVSASLWHLSSVSETSGLSGQLRPWPAVPGDVSVARVALCLSAKSIPLKSHCNAGV